ncbi:hypothetical protein NQ315_004458 [Exocentrus adspersus]|uniref:Cytochrome P450 n=1 Tax=Exocentrus adspersus TaxID=1586481 RepID=A0AAV8VPR0_9CUCU|nr:hypothetical protein NQ315_004458 [Exocentrus adspersus]
MKYWEKRGVEQGNPKWLFGHYFRNFIGKENGVEVLDKVYKQSPEARYTGMYRFCNPVLMVRDPDLIWEIVVKKFEFFMDHSQLVPPESDPLWSKNLLSLTGEYSGIYQFSVPTLLVKDPELIKQITVKDFDHFTDHRTVFPEDAESQKWRDMRTILSPSFTSSKMRSMFILMVECAENFVQHFLDENEDVVSIELKDTFTRFTNDMIASTAFGIKVDSLAEPNNPFYLKGKDVTDFTSLAKNLRFMAFFMFPKLCQVNYQIE